MRGDNPIRKRDEAHTGDALVLQGKPFLTIQGEGPHAGLRAVFVRLWGCNLKCVFCDTDFESDPVHYTLDELMPHFAPSSLVVLTGGEPLRQNVVPLVRKIVCHNRSVQIETAGTLWWEGLEAYDPHELQIVISPKTPTVHPRMQEAVAWKYIVSARHLRSKADGLPVSNTQRADDSHPKPLARPPQWLHKENILVQPMDEGDPALNAANMNLCVELALEFGYRVSLQQHKIIGVP